MNNEEPIDTLPNSVLDKHRIHVGNFKEGDYLLGNNDGTIYGVSNIQIDKIEGLEVRLAKERIDTEKNISNVYSWTSKKIFKLKDTIKEDQDFNKNKFKEIYDELNNRSEDLQDKINLERKIIEEELNKIKKTLIWISIFAFGLIGVVFYTLTHVFEKL